MIILVGDIFVGMPTPHIETAPADNTNWVTLVDIPKDEDDEVQGELKGVGVAAGYTDNHRIKITLDNDDNPIVSDKLISSFNEYGNGGMTLNIPFKTALKIEIKDQFSPRSRPRFWASFIVN